MNIDSILTKLRKELWDSMEGKDGMNTDWTQESANRVIDIIDDFTNRIKKEMSDEMKTQKQNQGIEVIVVDSYGDSNNVVRKWIYENPDLIIKQIALTSYGYQGHGGTVHCAILWERK